MKPPPATMLVPAAAGLLMALAPLAQAPAADKGLLGFSPAAAREERAVESRLVAALSAARLDAFHAELTREPHMAGTDESRALAEGIRRRLEEFGFETETRRYEAYLSYPKRVAVRRLAPSALELRVEEPAEPTDPDTAHPGLTPGFVAYSASGRVDGEIVYANYGLPADYEALDARGVSARGAIVLVRYGKVHRAVKVATAQARGALGILIYSDPADDGFAKGEVLPRGPWRGADLLQRGNAKLSWFFHGDPLTPGRAALPGAERLRAEDAPTLPKIPAAVLSSGAARSLLEGLAGSSPPDFAGALDLPYRTGPGPVRAELDVAMDTGLRTIVDVLGRIPGREEPEHLVLLGTHHDAWTFGGVDPGSSGACGSRAGPGLGDAGARGMEAPPDPGLRLLGRGRARAHRLDGVRRGARRPSAREGRGLREHRLLSGRSDQGGRTSGPPGLRPRGLCRRSRSRLRPGGPARGRVRGPGTPGQRGRLRGLPGFPRPSLPQPGVRLRDDLRRLPFRPATRVST